MYRFVLLAVPVAVIVVALPFLFGILPLSPTDPMNPPNGPVEQADESGNQSRSDDREIDTTDQSGENDELVDPAQTSTETNDETNNETGTGTAAPANQVEDACHAPPLTQNRPAPMANLVLPFSGMIPGIQGSEAYHTEIIEFDVPAGVEIDIQIVSRMRGEIDFALYLRGGMDGNYQEHGGYQYVIWEDVSDSVAEPQASADDLITRRGHIVLGQTVDRPGHYKIEMANISSVDGTYEVTVKTIARGDGGQLLDAGFTPETALMAPPPGAPFEGHITAADGFDLFRLEDLEPGALIEVSIVDLEGYFAALNRGGVTVTILKPLCDGDQFITDWTQAPGRVTADLTSFDRSAPLTASYLVEHPGDHFIHVDRTLGGGAYRYSLLLNFGQVAPEEITPVRLETNEGHLIEAFRQGGPYHSTVFVGDEVDMEDGLGRPYRLAFTVPSLAGNGTVTSSDPEIIEFANPDFNGEAIGPDNTINRSFFAKQPGQSTLTLDWTTQSGVQSSATLTIDVSPLNLTLDGVPDFAEFDGGGFVRTRNLIKLSIDVPDDQRTGLAVLEGAAHIRLWRDRAKTLPVPLTVTGSGPPRIEWPAGGAPAVLFIEGVTANSHSRGTIFRLGSVALPDELYLDEIAVTVVDIDLALPGVAETAEDTLVYHQGQNSDDDNGNARKDLADITAPVSGEDDLTQVIVKISPPLTHTLGTVELTLGRDLSLWSTGEKGETAALIDDLSRSESDRIELDPSQQNEVFYVEGISVSGTQAEMRLALKPALTINGARQDIGSSLEDVVHLMVVQADLDIDGVLDEEDDREFNIGAIVARLPNVEGGAGALTKLNLRMTPDSVHSGHILLELTAGTSKIKLWQDNGDDALRQIELEPQDDGTATTVFTPVETMPDHIFVQGVEASLDREVEIALSFAQDDNGNPGQIVSTDRVSLTVTEQDLVLRPLLIGALTNAAEQTSTVQLEVDLKESGSDEETDVTAVRAGTKYEWIGRGIPRAILDPTINALRAALRESTGGIDLGLDLATIDVDDQGLLTVSSPGLQLLHATHGGLDSNYALVLAGFKLESILLVPGPPDYPGVPDILEQMTVARVLSGALSSPENAWLVLTAETTGFWWTQGQVTLDDVIFEFLDGGPKIGLNDLLDAIRPVLDDLGAVALVPFLGPAAPIGSLFLVRGLESDFKELANEFVEYESSNTDVARMFLDVPGFSGIVESANPGFADIKGSLDLGDMGRADDKVTTWVLPTVDGVLIKASDDPEGDHSGPVTLNHAVAGGAVQQVWAHAIAGLPATAPIPFSRVPSFDAIENWQEEGVDQTFEAMGFTFHITGDLEIEATSEGPQYIVKNGVLGFDVPNANAALLDFENSWTVADENIARIGEIEPEADQVARRLSGNEVDGVAETEISVTVNLPLMGGATASRTVIVHSCAAEAEPCLEDEVTDCVAAMPIFHLRNGDVVTLDGRFDGTPYRDGLAGVDGPLAGLVTTTSELGPFPRSSRELSPSGPWKAGWIYAIEFPVNDPELCGLEEMRSSAAPDANGTDRDQTLKRRSRAQIVYGAAPYLDGQDQDYRGALVYVDARGWARLSATEQSIEKVSQRVSVYNLADHRYLYTALLNYQYMLDAGDGEPGFGHHLVGSSAGKVGETFNHLTALSAAARFEGLPPPPILP